MLSVMVGDECEAFHFYCNYAHSKGFSVRKGRQRYFEGTNQIRSKLFFCSKEGHKDGKSKSEANMPHLHIRDIRTGCPAMIQFSCSKTGEWRVNRFIKEHNHPMAEPEERHLLRSARQITSAQGGCIESMVNSGFGVVDSYRYMEDQCGGRGKLSFTMKDCYNFISLLKNSKIEAGDAQAVVNYFKAKHEQDPLFYWAVQLDESGRIGNFFWRDGNTRIDYEAFGDIVSFDTTYITNRYNLVCAPFVGINHHWQNVMFGCAFLSDETSETFQWLFETFMDAMSEKAPKTFFTDQAQAMFKPIHKVFRNTCHRLCQWHINRNAPSHVSGKALQLFRKCMCFVETEEEFEDVWKELLNDPDCSATGKGWLLKTMYDLRHKWSFAFNRNVFSAQVKATSRSESTNHVLNGLANRTTSLYDFVIGFEKMVSRWRNKERDEDFNCKNGKPTPVQQNCNMLQHGASLYTMKIYKIYESRYLEGVLTYTIEEEFKLGDVIRYRIASGGKNERDRIVELNMETKDASCSCIYFESMGVLCAHILKVFHHKKINYIPSQYIVQRWTVHAKKMLNKVDENGKMVKRNETETETDGALVFVNSMMRRAYDLVMRSKDHIVTRDLLSNVFDVQSNNIDDLLSNLNLDAQPSIERCMFEGNVISDVKNEAVEVLDPLYVKPRGISNERIKSHWDKKRKVAKTTKTLAQAKKKQAKSSEPQKSHPESNANDPFDKFGSHLHD